jgi:hypothetical protein
MSDAYGEGRGDRTGERLGRQHELDRAAQITRLFLVWSHEIVVRNLEVFKGQLDSALHLNCIDQFVNYHGQDRPLRWRTPVVAGSPVGFEEFRDLIGRLEQDGLMAPERSAPGQNWIMYPACRAQARPCMYAGLTDRGWAAAKREANRPVNPGWQRKLRIALLRCIGEHSLSGSPDPYGLGMFQADPHSVIDGLAPTLYEARDALVWLAMEELVQLGNAFDKKSRLVSMPISLVRAGLICLEEYEGDPLAMRDAQRRGDDRRQFNIGTAGNIVFDPRGEVTQIAAGSIEVTVDVPALREFALAVTQALPGLHLPADQAQVVEQTAGQIVQLARSFR